MPFNGAGTYSMPSLPGSFNPAVTGQQATATDWTTLTNDFVTAMSTMICLDGQSTITQNIPFNSKKITLLGNATLTTDAINAGQVLAGTITGVADTGAANAYAIGPAIGILAYAAYQRFQFVAANANTAASTLAVSSLAAKSIKRPNGDALIANDILAGAVCDVIYDGTNFILIDGGSNGINYSLLTTRGDIIARSATVPARLALGSNHTVLKSNGTDPAWGAVDLTADVTGVLPIANGGTGNSSIAGTTWTPVDASGASLTFTNVTAKYVQVGNMVYAYFSLTYPSTADTSPTAIGGLPVTAPNNNYANTASMLQNSSNGSNITYAVVIKNTVTAGIWSATAARFTNAQVTGVTMSGVIIYPAT